MEGNGHDSDPPHLKRQLAAKEGIDPWGLCEARPGPFEGFLDGAQHGKFDLTSSSVEGSVGPWGWAGDGHLGTGRLIFTAPHPGWLPGHCRPVPGRAAEHRKRRPRRPTPQVTRIAEDRFPVRARQ